MNNERDPMVALLAMDTMLPPHNFVGYGTLKISLGIQRRALNSLLRGRPIYPNSVRDDSPLTDEEMVKAKALLKQYLLDKINTGEWYSNQPIPERSPWEKMVGWVVGVAKKTPDELGYLVGDRVADWFVATRPNLATVTAPQAVASSIAWHRELANKNDEKAEKTALDTSHLKNVATLNAGVEIFELTPADLKDEGSVMKHCIGASPTYAQELRSGKARAFSVRRNKKRLYTVWTVKKNIEQFKAKANRIPGPGTDADAATQAIAWFASKGIADNCYDISVLRGGDVAPDGGEWL